MLFFDYLRRISFQHLRATLPHGHSWPSCLLSDDASGLAPCRFHLGQTLGTLEAGLAPWSNLLRSHTTEDLGLPASPAMPSRTGKDCFGQVPVACGVASAAAGSQSSCAEAGGYLVAPEHRPRTCAHDLGSCDGTRRDVA